MHERKRLSDILPRADRENLARLWDATKPADDLGLLPAGEYSCRVLDGTLSTAKTGTSGYKITFEIIDGPHAGRRIWHDIWISPAAMSMAKRDLEKIGVTHFDQLDSPVPTGILATVRLVVRKEDDETQRNRVRDFRVTGVEADEPAPFAPTTESFDGSMTDADGFNWQAGHQAGEAKP
jgi:hypothetical protein